MKLFPKIAIVLLPLLALSYAGYSAYQKKQDEEVKAKASREPVVPVFEAKDITQPQSQSLGTRLEWSGSLSAAEQVTVRSKAAGTLMSLTVKEGDRVKAGQSLGVIDLSDMKTRSGEREAAVQSAQAALKLAQTQFESNQKLADKSFISPVALETARNQLDAAKAQLKAAQSQQGTLNIAMREAALIAPISGRISKRSALPGEKISMEQALISIVQSQTLEMIGALAPHEANKVKPGATAQVTVDGVSGSYSAIVDRVGPVAEIGSRALPVVLKIANPDEQLQPGQFANAVLSMSDDKKSLTLPIEAVQLERGQAVVWVVEKSSLKRKAITQGQRDAQGKRVEVLEGLSAESQVLAQRFDNLRDGQTIKINAGKP
jgi:membrane fusion protein, multidrug efflux system